MVQVAECFLCWLVTMNRQFNIYNQDFLKYCGNLVGGFLKFSRVQINSQPLAILLFDQSKLTLVGHIYCTFAME